jgi:16S rRNA (guanine527-N7)-methyltransferase
MGDKSIKQIAALAGIPVTDEECRDFEFYIQELMKWNKKINLTAITDYEEILEKHLIDSLFLLKYLPENGVVLDMGSGAGLPGIAVAICRKYQNIISVDSVGKKINYQKNIKRHLGLDNLFPVAARIERFDPAEIDQQVNFIVTRAFSSVGEIVRYSKRLLDTGGRIFAMKGPEGEKEIEENMAEITEEGFVLSAVHNYNLPISQAKRSIIIIEKMSFD